MTAKFSEVEYVTDAYGNINEMRFVPTIAPSRLGTHIDLDAIIESGISITMDGVDHDVGKDELYAAIRRAFGWHEPGIEASR